MHRKRVTCELHNSYFHLMTIKHAIPKIEWAIELLYNSVKTGSQWVGDQRSRRQEVLEKATAGRGGPQDFRLSLETRPVGEKMLEWQHVPMRMGPQASGWAAQENENDTRRCPEKATADRGGPQDPRLSLETRPVGEKIEQPRRTPEGLGRSICCSLCSVSNSLSHANLSIKWELYFSKNCVARLYHCVFYHCVIVFCMNLYMCIVVAYDYTT